MINAITSLECWEKLSKERESALIDVRSKAEHQKYGIPDLISLGKKLVTIPLLNVDMSLNANFTTEVSSCISKKEPALFFMCKTHRRSTMAAELMAKLGYKNCYYIIEGIGWKDHGLPWSI